MRISLKSPLPIRMTKKAETLSRYQLTNSIMIGRSPGSESISKRLHHPTRNEPVWFPRRRGLYLLKTSTGLTRVARLAGTSAAVMATPPSNSATPTNVTGSLGSIS